MAEFQRVPLRPRQSRNWLPTVGLAFAVFLALAIVKPWEIDRPGAADASPAPTFFVRPTERTGPRAYDPILFGGREPDPAWELWPAGYVVQFGLAGPVKVHGQDGASPAPGGSAAASSPAAPDGSGLPVGSAPSSAAPTAPPLEPGVVDLGTADHLVALGINTPLDVRVVVVRLFSVTGIRTDEVLVVRLPTLWESTHFIVIAPADPAQPGQPVPWEPGLYRLELTTALGDVRVVDLRVGPPTGPSN
jgi:hypothetical protein